MCVRERERERGDGEKGRGRWALVHAHGRRNWVSESEFASVCIARSWNGSGIFTSLEKERVNFFSFFFSFKKNRWEFAFDWNFRFSEKNGGLRLNDTLRCSSSSNANARLKQYKRSQFMKSRDFESNLTFFRLCWNMKGIKSRQKLIFLNVLIVFL